MVIKKLRVDSAVSNLSLNLPRCLLDMPIFAWHSGSNYRQNFQKHQLICSSNDQSFPSRTIFWKVILSKRIKCMRISSFKNHHHNPQTYSKNLFLAK